MKYRNASVILAFGMLVLVSAGPTWATPITVVNPSFEAPVVAINTGNSGSGPTSSITGWSVVNGAQTGVFHPSSTQFTGGVTDLQTAYIDTGAALIYQVVGTVTANIKYTLNVDVGNQLSSPFTDYRVALFAGSGIIGSTLLAATNDSPVPTDGFFATTTTIYTAPGSGPLIGQPLQIRLRHAGLGRMHFDNVRLDAVPEPASLMLLGAGLAGLGIWRRKSAKR